MQESSSFWNKTAKKYAAQPVGDQAAYERKLEMTQALFTKEAIVAEFGCGTGTTSLIHAPHVKQIWATDIAEKMIEIAWGKAQDQGVENVLFEVADIASYAPEPEKYDVVMMHSLLHLLKDRKSAISKAYEMVKPGGYFVSSTVCLSGKLALMMPLIRVMQLFGKAPYVSFFSGEALSKEITEAGFSISEYWKPEGGMAVFIIARKPG